MISSEALLWEVWRDIGKHLPKYIFSLITTYIYYNPYFFSLKEKNYIWEINLNYPQSGFPRLLSHIHQLLLLADSDLVNI